MLFVMPLSVNAESGVLVDAQHDSATNELRADELSDSVLASIDGEPITFLDLTRYLQQLKGQDGVSDRSLDRNNLQAVKATLFDYIGDELIKKEAQLLGLSTGEEEIVGYMEQVARQNNTDLEGLKQFLERKGVTMESYKKQIARDILRTRVISVRIRSKTTVSDEDIKRYLAAHPGRAPQQGTMHLAQILVPIGEENSVIAAQDLAEKIKEGADFEALGGRYYSDLGFVRAEELLSEFQEPIAKLAVGEISNLIETSKGYHLLKLISKKESEDDIDEKLKEEIREELSEEQRKVEIERFLQDELQKKYHVELKI
jgi:peptidyl-prolyl cis-trans isomerase SurA